MTAITRILQCLNGYNGLLTALATIVLAFLTLCLAIIASEQERIIDNQLKVMRGQLSVMEADQRPWVSIGNIDGISISSPLHFDEIRGAGMSIRYVLRNTGKSPALHVRWRSKLIFLPKVKFSTEEIKEQQNMLCEPLREIANDFNDAVVFPGDNIVGEQMTGMSPKEIASALSSGEYGPFAHKGFITLALVACVDYELSDQSKHHQTRYAFLLGVPMDGAIMQDLKPEGTRPDARLIYFSQSAD